MARAEIRAPFRMVVLSIAKAAFDGLRDVNPVEFGQGGDDHQKVIRSRCPIGRSVGASGSDISASKS